MNLSTECLRVLPLGPARVGNIFAQASTCPGWTVRELCLSHERLRAELAGAEVLLSEAGLGPRLTPAAPPTDPPVAAVLGNLLAGDTLTEAICHTVASETRRGA